MSDVTSEDVLTPAVVEFLTGPVATVSSGGA